MKKQEDLDDLFNLDLNQTNISQKASLSEDLYLYPSGEIGTLLVEESKISLLQEFLKWLNK